MEVVDVRALEEAVLVFYQSGSSQHAAAHEWLTKAQTSPQAWSFVWELMRLDKVSNNNNKQHNPHPHSHLHRFDRNSQSSEIQFFGATTLHCKLVKNWTEVPKESYEELKQKLLDTIILFGAGPRIVLNRLCISVSNPKRG